MISLANGFLCQSRGERHSGAARSLPALRRWASRRLRVDRAARRRLRAPERPARSRARLRSRTIQSGSAHTRCPRSRKANPGVTIHQVSELTSGGDAAQIAQIHQNQSAYDMALGGLRGLGAAAAGEADPAGQPGEHPQHQERAPVLPQELPLGHTDRLRQGRAGVSQGSHDRDADQLGRPVGPRAQVLRQDRASPTSTSTSSVLLCSSSATTSTRPTRAAERRRSRRCSTSSPTFRRSCRPT